MSLRSLFVFKILRGVEIGLQALRAPQFRTSLSRTVDSTYIMSSSSTCSMAANSVSDMEEAADPTDRVERVVDPDQEADACDRCSGRSLSHMASVPPPSVLPPRFRWVPLLPRLLVGACPHSRLMPSLLGSLP